MLVGNPCDDWNWMEELNRFMDVPRNHPGAFADVGFEHDRYDAEVIEDSLQADPTFASEMWTRKPARGLIESVRVDRPCGVFFVRYISDPAMSGLSVDCGSVPRITCRRCERFGEFKPVRPPGFAVGARRKRWPCG